MRLLWLWSILILVSGTCAAQEDYLLVLVSQRNAETIAEAARSFSQQYPAYRIVARTESQLNEQPQATAELIRHSHGILGMGLYGPVVEQLAPLLKASNTPQLFMNSDHRLVVLSRWQGKPVFDDDNTLKTLAKSHPEDTAYDRWIEALTEAYPRQQPWIYARAYWQAGGSDNTSQLFAWYFAQHGATLAVNKPALIPRLRWMHRETVSAQFPNLRKGNLTVVIDHSGGGRPADKALLQSLCHEMTVRDSASQCIAAIAFWGEAGVQSVTELTAYLRANPRVRLQSIVMLQDFVIGAGEGREAVTQKLVDLNVPLIKAIKLRDRTEADWLLSADGLAYEKVYYQVAMPELQGASQPLVVATAGQARNDPLTGIRIQAITPNASGIESVATRVQRWAALQTKANKDKRIAVVYYNHPPGRHNIGADNLDVPASLWQILTQLQAQGYHTGKLPESPEALLDKLQKQGVNLPNDQQALANMSQHIQRIDLPTYQAWFDTFPETVKQDIEFGPFGLLHSQVQTAIESKKYAIADNILHHTFEEMHHLLEGVDHKGRERALALAEQLESCYVDVVDQHIDDCMETAPALVNALQNTGVEGLGGWGAAPGEVMTYQDEILIPGLQFGNVFVGPQPPRGWEINEELLHANLAFPPPHQYLAFYQYLQHDFKADALVHLGRHSTYEFLPRRSVGLASDDYARLIAGDIPGVYPYIVDGVGEGIQAKRRGLAVMVDHLTPPLKSTPLYDQLLQLRQLVESFETLHGSKDVAVTQRLVGQIRDKVDELELKDELAEAMSAELAVMGISFDEVDDDMLVHEVGHYLTDLQERFMPHGLHIFGRDWESHSQDMMLESMAPSNAQERSLWRDQLLKSPSAEMAALVNGLAGGFIAPGQGNDPIRSPNSLPTGRNFYALDSSLIPSPVAWQLGQSMAQTARASNHQSPEKREAVILWASDVVRDEGVMIAFGLDMLGLEPVWNSRGLVKGLRRQSLNEGRVRRDMVFTTSGLFRDLYGQQMMLLNRATLMALDASADTITQRYPALTLALSAALEDLGKEAVGGNESLEQNQVAAHWVKQTRAAMAAGQTATQAGLVAAQRVFGDAPGSYGAGINRMAERSGAWEKRSELAAVYLRRLGHSYGLSGFGTPAHDAFETVLGDVENTYFGRSSNLYGLIDNNDAFDYLGGLSLTIETITGAAPNNFVLDHSDPNRVNAQPLSIALRQELRGRFLNPEWLKPLMDHGYAGARTMGSEFLEYLWGWQITNPTLVGDWAWEEVKAVYIDDRYALGLDEFLEEGHNAHVKANMLAVMLVAVHKEFWNAEDETIQQLATAFAQLVAEQGLPGSGHTDPNHPMLPWLEQHLSQALWQQLQQQMRAAKTTAPAANETHRITEIALESAEQPAEAKPPNTSTETSASERQWLWPALIAFAIVLIVAAGFSQSIRSAGRK